MSNFSDLTYEPGGSGGGGIDAGYSVRGGGRGLSCPVVTGMEEALAPLGGTESPASSSVASDGSLIDPLTPREREVLGLLTEFLTTEEIASSMFVSVNTVRTHVRNILRKLDASRRNEAVRRAWALGLLNKG